MAQIIRAILLANAIATSIFGLRAIIRASQDPSGIDFLPNQFRRDIAPIISSRLISACPAFDTRPRRSLPPSVVAARNARSFFFLSSVIECGLL